jgi:hypothetical protein
MADRELPARSVEAVYVNMSSQKEQSGIGGSSLCEHGRQNDTARNVEAAVFMSM